MFKNFRSYQMALALYRAILELSIKSAIEADQLKRASLSIVLNLAEGSGKRTAKDRRRFFQMSFGSLREVQSLLEILEEDSLAEQADQLAGSIWRLCQRPGCLPP